MHDARFQMLWEMCQLRCILENFRKKGGFDDVALQLVSDFAAEILASIYCNSLDTFEP